MEQSVTRALMESDFVETRVLKALISAFSSTFSLREIASAYCKAGRNPDITAQMLYDGAGKLKKSYSNAESVVSTTQCETSCISSSASCEGVADKPPCADYRNSKASKMAVSIGSVSGVIGKEHVMSNTPAWNPRSCILCESVANKPNWVANKGSKVSKLEKLALSAGSATGPAEGPVSTNEPLKWDMKDLAIDELIDEDVSSDSTPKEDQIHTEPGKIFVGGMSWDTDEAILKDHFNKFGEVMETNILIDRTTGCSRGFGFVRFSDKALVDKVLLEKHVILGKKVDVGKVVLKHNDPYNNGQFRTKQIFVRGLSPNLTRDEFKAYFEKFGKTTDAVIMYDFLTHIPRGFGFITFNSEEAVENVLQKTFHELNGKEVVVKRAVPKDVINNCHNGGFNMRMNGDRRGFLLVGGEGAYRPNRGAVMGSKASKPKNLALSVGSTSGKGHVMRNTPAYRPVSATKPMEVDIKDLLVDELMDEDVSSDSAAKEDQMHTGDRCHDWEW